MSAEFILEYGGKPVEFDLGVHLVDEAYADRFASESDAWHAAHKEGLNPARCKVVNLHERNSQKISKLIHDAPANCVGRGELGPEINAASKVSAAAGQRQSSLPANFRLIQL